MLKRSLLLFENRLARYSNGRGFSSFSSYSQRNNALRSTKSNPSKNVVNQFNGNRQDHIPPKRDNRGSLWKWAIGIATVSSAGYYYTHLDYVPITGRRRIITISAEEERMMGKIACDQILHQYRGRVISQTHPYSRLVKNVGVKLLYAANMDPSEWEFYVIDSSEVNAFVLPDKKVFVFAGILPVLQDDTGVATVLSHEIAHQYARHSAERKQELEADHIGLLLMAAAHYDPRKAVPFWKRMEAVQGGGTEFLSTHPSSSTRIEKINEHLPEAVDIYLLSKSIKF